MCHGRSHLIVDSRAGTAKTTTAVEGVARCTTIRPRDKILVTTFDTRGRTELQNRFAQRALENPPSVLGIHQIGFALLRGAFRGIQMNEEKGTNCAAAAVLAHGYYDQRNIEKPDRDWLHRVDQLAALAKSTLAESEDDIVQLAREYDLADEDFAELELAAMTAEALRLAYEDISQCDFDDQIWLPIRYGIEPRTRFDIVVGDEVQDWTKADLWTLQKAIAADGRMILFGDPFQNLYTFRGADAFAMQRMASILDASPQRLTTAKLTTTYRCPRRVVDAVRFIVPDYEAAPNAPDGVERDATYAQMIEEAMPGDYILSRRRAPLGRVCLSLVRRGKPSYIRGRNFVEPLLALIQRSRAATIDVLDTWLAKHGDREFDRYVKLDQSRRAHDTKDRCETLRALAEACASIAELRQRVKTLFTDKAPQDSIICSTVHGAKGDERRRVWVLDWSFSRDSNEELRIIYVAYTRSMHELVHVAPPPSSAGAHR